MANSLTILLLGPFLMASMPTLAVAALIHPQDSVLQWFEASKAEKLAYVERFVSLCKPIQCTGADIKECMDERLHPPLAPEVQNLKIADAATMCVSDIESKQWAPNRVK
jgi:hypothetical protein